MGTFCAHSCSSVRHTAKKSISALIKRSAANSHSYGGLSVAGLSETQTQPSANEAFSPRARFILLVFFYFFFLSQTPPSDCGPPTTTAATAAHPLLSLSVSLPQLQHRRCLFLVSCWPNPPGALSCFVARQGT